MPLPYYIHHNPVSVSVLRGLSSEEQMALASTHLLTAATANADLTLSFPLDSAWTYWTYIMNMNVQDWLRSADVMVSLLLDSLGNTDYMEDWDLCLRLLENLSLDLIGQVQCLLEDRAVCAHFLGSLWADDLSAWAFLYI